MKEYQFNWRRQFFNQTFRYGRWRRKIITAQSLGDACKKMVDYLNYFNIEVSEIVMVDNKEENISNQNIIQHLLTCEVV